MRPLEDVYQLRRITIVTEHNRATEREPRASERKHPRNNADGTQSHKVPPAAWRMASAGCNSRRLRCTHTPQRTRPQRRQSSLTSTTADHHVDAMFGSPESTGPDRPRRSRHGIADGLERERASPCRQECGIRWRGVQDQHRDTPGHADFGGEVERALSMVDAPSCCGPAEGRCRKPASCWPRRSAGVEDRVGH